MNTSLKKEWKWLKIVLDPIGSESEITAKKSQTQRLIKFYLISHYRSSQSIEKNIMCIVCISHGSRFIVRGLSISYSLAIVITDELKVNCNESVKDIRHFNSLYFQLKIILYAQLFSGFTFLFRITFVFFFFFTD